MSPFQRQRPSGDSATSMSEIPPQIRLHPLHLAVAISSYAVVQCLLDNGACVNALDSFNRNPLHILIQTPPIEPSPPDSVCLFPITPKVTDTRFENDREDYRNKKLSEFLYKQAGKRSSNEIKIATLLCNNGIDLSRCDKWGHTCIEYATQWLRISRLIRSGDIGPHLLISKPLSISHSLTHTDDIDCPIPLNPQYDTSVLLAVQLTNRVPHEIIDVIFLYEDRLRLSAISSIVGINVGGPRSPHQLIVIPSHHSSIPMMAACTPTRSAQSISNVKNTVNDVTMLSIETQRREDLPYRSRDPSGHFGRIRTTRTSLERRALHVLRTPSQNSVNGITISSPGITRLSVRFTPEIQNRLRIEQQSPDQTTTPTQSTLAENCLRQFKRSARRRIEDAKNKSLTTSPVKDDLAVFLSLASTPRFRFHSALLGIWEFLGADIFPQENRESHSLEPTIYHDLDNCHKSRDNLDINATTDNEDSMNVSPIQPELRNERLSLLCIRLDSDNNQDVNNEAMRSQIS